MRLGKNPNHYKINGDPIGQGLDDRVEQICQREIGLLRETDLVSSDGRLRSTEFGDAMARYYIRFGTMQKLLSLQPRARMSEIVSCVRVKRYKLTRAAVSFGRSGRIQRCSSSRRGKKAV